MRRPSIRRLNLWRSSIIGPKRLPVYRKVPQNFDPLKEYCEVVGLLWNNPHCEISSDVMLWWLLPPGLFFLAVPTTSGRQLSIE
jgi:hypothetical protein